MAWSGRARGLVRDVQYRVGMSVFAAVAAGLVALTLWSSAEAAETRIRAFPFSCDTPDGEIVKPRHGDIEGVSYTDLPAQRAQCLGTIDRKIALCWENTEFATETENQEFAACLSLFRSKRGRASGTSRSSGQSAAPTTLTRTTVLRASGTKSRRWRARRETATE